MKNHTYLVNLFLLWILFYSISFICISDNNDTEKNNYSTQTNHYEILSLNEMSQITGGCSGGACTNYSHTCPSNCTYYSASRCSGTVGSCVENYWYLLCDCPGYYDFISGC